jgi:hypothetical protein
MLDAMFVISVGTEETRLMKMGWQPGVRKVIMFFPRTLSMTRAPSSEGHRQKISLVKVGNDGAALRIAKDAIRTRLGAPGFLAVASVTLERSPLLFVINDSAVRTPLSDLNVEELLKNLRRVAPIP